MPSIGLSISARSGLGAGAFGDFAARAEDAGFSAVFATENASDALGLAAAMAARTERVRVGTAVANINLRHPAALAAAAATLDEFSGGRLVLGLGTGSPAFNTGVLGLPHRAPLGHLGEYVDVLRQVLSGGEATLDGRWVQVGGYRLNSAPIRSGLPLYIGALGPRMLELAGRIGDGVMLNLRPANAAAQALGVVREAAVQAGRDPGAVASACVIPCCVTDDAGAAESAARELVSGYARQPGARGLMNSFGLGPATEDGEVDPRLVEALVAAGPADVVRARVGAFLDAGVREPILFPLPIDGDWAGSVAAAIEAFRD
ncbi:LLM class flavin-dependent oxidoreductase [Streptomyces sp. NPDC055078]